VENQSALNRREFLQLSTASIGSAWLRLPGSLSTMISLHWWWDLKARVVIPPYLYVGDSRRIA
jgi:hypothetical protein